MKNKNNKNSKKPRKFTLQGDIGKVVTANVSITPDGKLVFKEEEGESLKNKELWASVIYERESKKIPKIILRFPVEEPSLNVRHAIKSLEKYRYICAIDTNTLPEPIKGEFVSAGVFLQLLKGNHLKLHCELFSHAERNIGEKVFLATIVNRIMNEFLHEASNVQIAIITDHDLGNIPKYNSRELPLAACVGIRI